MRAPLAFAVLDFRLQISSAGSKEHSYYILLGFDFMSPAETLLLSFFQHCATGDAIPNSSEAWGTRGSCQFETIPMLPVGTSGAVHHFAVGTPTWVRTLASAVLSGYEFSGAFPQSRSTHFSDELSGAPLSASSQPTHTMAVLCRRCCRWIWTSGTQKKKDSLAEFVRLDLE